MMMRGVVLALSSGALLGCGLVDDLPEPVAHTVRLNELLADNTDGPDWIELYNIGSAPVDLAGWVLSDGSEEWSLVGLSVPGLGFLVLVCDEQAPFRLSAAGETLVLRAPQQIEVDSVQFGAQVTDESYGRAVDGTGDWRVQIPTRGGSNVRRLDGGVPDTGVPSGQVRINEVMSDNLSGPLEPDLAERVDWIELYQETGDPIDLGGWSLGHEPTPAGPWRFPEGTTLASGGFLLVWADGRDEALHTDFELSASGASLSLADADGRSVDRLNVPALAADQSFGRTPDGGEGTGVLAVSTPGASNL